MCVGSRRVVRLTPFSDIVYISCDITKCNWVRMGGWGRGEATLHMLSHRRFA